MGKQHTVLGGQGGEGREKFMSENGPFLQQEGKNGIVK